MIKISLRKTWVKFFAFTLLIIGLLSATMMVVFYYSSTQRETTSTQAVYEFVRDQKKDLLKNVVNNAIAEISVQKFEAEETTADKSEVYDIVLDTVQRYADSHVPLGGIELRIDALNSYDMRGDFAIRIITPFFQRAGEININASNAHYYDGLQELFNNGEAYTALTADGNLERIVYARLFRPYDWVVSACVSAEDLQQLTNILTVQFQEQQDRQMLIIAVFCVAFTLTSLTVFAQLGRLFFRRASSDFEFIEDLSNTDALTGIRNRRYFDNMLRSTVNSLSRSDGFLSVLLVDVDFFKNYNDAYGHEQGDICLRAVAQKIEETLTRETDLVARYGGEEFAIVLPGTGEAGARLIADKLLKNIRSLNLPHEKSPIAPYVTVSIGAASGKVAYTFEQHDWKHYMRKADEALYQSKRSGRNKYSYLDFKKKKEIA